MTLPMVRLSPTASWWYCICCLLGGTAIALAGWLHAGKTRLRAQALQDSLATPQTEAPAPQQTTAARTFVDHLPAPAPAAAFVARLERAARKHAVTVSSVAVAEQAPAPGALGRQTFSLGLRGTYPAVKQLLGDMQAPADGFDQLRLRYDVAGGAVEAMVRVSSWSAPLPMTTVAGR